MSEEAEATSDIPPEVAWENATKVRRLIGAEVGSPGSGGRDNLEGLHQSKSTQLGDGAEVRKMLAGMMEVPNQAYPDRGASKYCYIPCRRKDKVREEWTRRLGTTGRDEEGVGNHSDDGRRSWWMPKGGRRKAEPREVKGQTPIDAGGRRAAKGGSPEDEWRSAGIKSGGERRLAEGTSATGGSSRLGNDRKYSAERKTPGAKTSRMSKGSTMNEAKIIRQPESRNNPGNQEKRRIGESKYEVTGGWTGGNRRFDPEVTGGCNRSNDRMPKTTGVYNTSGGKGGGRKNEDELVYKREYTSFYTDYGGFRRSNVKDNKDNKSSSAKGKEVCEAFPGAENLRGRRTKRGNAEVPWESGGTAGKRRFPRNAEVDVEEVHEYWKFAEVAREHEGSVVTPSMVIGEPMQRSAEYARNMTSFRRFRQDAEQEHLPEAEIAGRKYNGEGSTEGGGSVGSGPVLLRPEVTQTGGSRAQKPGSDGTIGILMYVHQEHNQKGSGPGRKSTGSRKGSESKEDRTVGINLKVTTRNRGDSGSGPEVRHERGNNPGGQDRKGSVTGSGPRLGGSSEGNLRGNNQKGSGSGSGPEVR
ncbi:hypothetical protein B0H12DRAFT_1215512 [Mycena haematopus]|nr:hypothetical protein B0H12DRAFT_1215512 [Mycena haematopus]